MARDAGQKALERKKRRQVAVLGVLIVAGLIIGVVQFIQKQPKGAAASEITGSETPSGANEGRPRNAAAPTRPIEVSWPVELNRDLFAWEDVFPQQIEQPNENTPVDEPTGATAEQVRMEARKHIQLQAILFSDHPIARINGANWQQGDVIDGFRIVRIEQRQIVVEKDGFEIVLELNLLKGS